MDQLTVHRIIHALGPPTCQNKGISYQSRARMGFPTKVATFIRRCGLKRLMPRIRHFKVDGALLMTFDPEDFMILGRIDSVHTKKVGGDSDDQRLNTLFKSLK